MDTHSYYFETPDLIKLAWNGENPDIDALLCMLPDKFGINLSSVDGIEFECEKDQEFSQLVSMKIRLHPAVHDKAYDDFCKNNDAGSWDKRFRDWKLKIESLNEIKDGPIKGYMKVMDTVDGMPVLPDITDDNLSEKLKDYEEKNKQTYRDLPDIDKERFTNRVLKLIDDIRDIKNKFFTLMSEAEDQKKRLLRKASDLEEQWINIFKSNEQYTPEKAGDIILEKDNIENSLNKAEKQFNTYQSEYQQCVKNMDSFRLLLFNFDKYIKNK